MGKRQPLGKRRFDFGYYFGGGKQDTFFCSGDEWGGKARMSPPLPVTTHDRVASTSVPPSIGSPRRLDGWDFGFPEDRLSSRCVGWAFGFDKSLGFGRRPWRSKATA